MRHSKKNKTKNWVVSAFKGIVASIVILLIIAMIAEKNYDDRLRKEAHRVSMVTGIPEKYLYEEDDIYNAIDLDVLKGLEEEYAMSRQDSMEEQKKTADLEREKAESDAEIARSNAERKAEEEARHIAAHEAYDKEYEEIRRKIEAEIQAHIDEYNASMENQSTESYYDLTHDSAAEREYYEHRHDGHLKYSINQTSGSDKTEAEKEPDDTSSSGEEADTEEIAYRIDEIRIDPSVASGVVVNQGSSGSPYDEIHVSDQYKQNIYYNPQGTRIKGIDEINFVNDPYHK